MGPPTWVRVLQFLLESREGRSEGLWVLEEHLVQKQHGLLANVRLGGAQLTNQISNETKIIVETIIKVCFCIF